MIVFDALAVPHVTEISNTCVVVVSIALVAVVGEAIPERPVIPVK